MNDLKSPLFYLLAISSGCVLFFHPFFVIIPVIIGCLLGLDKILRSKAHSKEDVNSSLLQETNTRLQSLENKFNLSRLAGK